MIEKTSKSRWQDQVVTVAFSFALVAESPVGRVAAAAQGAAFAAVPVPRLPA